MTGRRKRRQGAFVASGTAPFVERARELAVLRGLLKKTKAGRGNLVVITGEPGIGKTRLADHFAAEFGSPSAPCFGVVVTLILTCRRIGRGNRSSLDYAERRDDAALQRDLGAGAHGTSCRSLPNWRCVFRSSRSRRSTSLRKPANVSSRVWSNS